MRKSVLALVLAAVSIAALAATPADAKQRHRAAPAAQQSNQQQLPGSAISPGNDPTGVYRNGRLIGRDPDPAIRLQIEQYFGRGAAS
jgi:hypothetical protein